MAWEKKWQPIWIESDSLIAVGAVNQTCLPHHSCAALIHLIQDLMNRDWTVKVTHVMREGNQVADVLAGLAHGKGNDALFLAEPPRECASSLFSDLCGIGFQRGFGR